MNVLGFPVMEANFIKLQGWMSIVGNEWQNGKVERSHRKDDKILYNCKIFTSKRS